MTEHFDLFNYKPSSKPVLREIEIIVKDHHRQTFRIASVKRPPLEFENDLPRIRQEAHDKLDALMDALGLR